MAFDRFPPLNMNGKARCIMNGRFYGETGDIWCDIPEERWKTVYSYLKHIIFECIVGLKYSQLNALISMIIDIDIKKIVLPNSL